MKLIKYRDSRDYKYEYFWTHNTFMVGPIFSKEQDALDWYKEHFEKIFGVYSTVGSADRQD